MNTNNLKDRTKQFGLTILKYLEKLPAKQPYFSIANQLTRCSTSVGANYRAANRGKSSADFINKLKIVEEECDETMFFIEILIVLIPKDKIELTEIHSEGNEILSIVVASIKTARRNQIK